MKVRNFVVYLFLLVRAGIAVVAVRLALLFLTAAAAPGALVAAGLAIAPAAPRSDSLPPTSSSSPAGSAPMDTNFF